MTTPPQEPVNAAEADPTTDLLRVLLPELRRTLFAPPEPAEKTAE